MSERASTLLRPCPSCGRALSGEVGLLAGRLAGLIEGLPSVQRELAGGVAFLRSLGDAAAGRPGGDGAPRRAGEAPTLTRLIEGLSLSPLERDLVVLAGMAEEHEGLASVLASLHPQAQPWPTPGLAAQLFAPGPDARRVLRRTLVEGAAVRTGVLVLTGDGPLFTRSLRLGEALWDALHGTSAWPAGLEPSARVPVASGLEGWLDGPAAGRARRALASGAGVTVFIAGDPPDAAADAAAALTDRVGRPWFVTEPAEAPSGERLRLVALHALLRGAIPVVTLPEAPDGDAREWEALDAVPVPLVLAGPAPSRGFGGRRALHLIEGPAHPDLDRERMWRAVLPELDGDAEAAASCYRLSPGVAGEVAADARYRASLEGRAPELRDIAASLRGRVSAESAAGVRLVRPSVAWEQLVLRPDRKRQLEEAADRLRHQVVVLDRWGFLRGRPGSRGVRVLLSGPPGTGKTLAAEALAGRLGVDLLLVDLSRVVSKWIGETEKHLSRIFETAERTQAVLLFDEADALFGKRTEVSDAHDRYANLETAYLLSRLERFEGLVALSTNLKRNIDTAFLRRLEFVVELEPPEADEREAIWLAHVPEGVPLATDVSFRELATLYPIVGGLIRNAAVAAAFLAAGDGNVITRRYLVQAVRREYAKAGLAFPGVPPGFTEN